MVEKIGKYSIIEKIGVGGFGEVYKGYDPFIKRHIAVKTCATGDQEIRKRFFQEAEIAGNLNHRNITTVYDFGIQDNLPYLIQEYLSGEDLDRKIKRRDFLPFPEKLYYLLQIARGLAYAHANGVIHRDIKPANIRILEDGTAKIMDFGIAKLAQQETGLTQTGMTLGTAAYLAPEQVRGDAVDHRTDLFSYGVLAYELLTYQRPFQGKQISTVLYEILNNTPPPIQELWPEAPPTTAALIERCLQKDSSLRPRDGNELLRGLEKVQKEGRANRGRYEDGPTIQLTGPDARAFNESFQSATGPPEPPPTQRPAVETTPSQATRTAAATHRSIELLDRSTTASQPAQSPLADLPSQQVTRDGLDDIVFAGGREREEISATGTAPRPRSSFGGMLLLIFLAAVAGGVGWWFGTRNPEATAENTAAPDPQEVVDLTAEDVAAAPSTLAETPPQAAAPEQDQPPAAAEDPPPAAPIPASIVIPLPEWTRDMSVVLAGRTYSLDRRRQIELAPGTYTATFQVSMGSYRASQETQVKVGDGERFTLRSPIPQPGTLSVRPLPGRPQGQVSLGEIDLGSSPIRKVLVAPGDQVLEVRPLSGDGGSISEPFTIEPAQEIVVSFDLNEDQISIRTKEPSE